MQGRTHSYGYAGGGGGVEIGDVQSLSRVKGL